MQKRKKGSALPRTGFARRGHRSHVKGERRFLAGKKKSAIQDVLHADAERIGRTLIHRSASE